MKEVNIIGAGLAGSEAAYYLLKKGYKVNLYEQKPKNFSPAHKSQDFAELVCSNSFKSTEPSTAAGILKNELTLLGSVCLQAAQLAAVPAGQSLAVDRELFSKNVTKILKKFKNLNVINQEVESIDLTVPTIVATGPLTSENLGKFILNEFGQQQLSFFDAIAPIVEHDSINFNHAFFGNRYDKGDTKDFVNCPMNKDEYLAFHSALTTAPTAPLKDFEKGSVYEGCMPVEVLAKRGIDALRFGPLKPVGFTDPETGKGYYAVVQLRKENLQSLSYNMVGFQTNLTYSAQKEVFSLIPALKTANFLRYGVMHKNAYVNAPNLLNSTFQTKKHANVFIAGQLSGVEGYIESMASGLMSAMQLHKFLQNKPFINFTTSTIMGGLSHYIANASAQNFQPMGCNLGLLKPLDEIVKNKKLKGQKYYERSQAVISEIISTQE